jgi:hypothetical protein
MGAQLTHKVRSYLVSSKPDMAQLSPEEERALLLKVNEELRTGTLFPIQIYSAKILFQSSNHRSFSCVDGVTVCNSPSLRALFTFSSTQTTSFFSRATANAFTS